MNTFCLIQIGPHKGWWQKMTNLDVYRLPLFLAEAAHKYGVIYVNPSGGYHPPMDGEIVLETRQQENFPNN